MGRLDNKTAIITGAAAGIGRAAAILFAQEGAKVVVADIAVEGGEQTARMVREAGGEAIFVRTDVSRAGDIKRMIKTAIDTYSKIDVLFNNAGLALFSALTESTETDFDKMIGVNLKGEWLGMKYAIPEMIKNGGGSIINTSSIDADHGHSGASIYCASKGAIVSMTKVAAVECGPHRIRVNCIKPGPTDTAQGTGLHSPKVIKHFEARTPDGRWGRPEDIAHLALFFASDESVHISGQDLAVDGGMEVNSNLNM